MAFHDLEAATAHQVLAACGLDASYIRLAIKKPDFLPALRAIRDLGFIGTNVTIPHKFTALDSVDEVSPAARRLGAVNTITFRPDGTAYGQNSDGPGFVRTVREEFGADVKDLRILLLGAGWEAEPAAPRHGGVR